MPRQAREKRGGEGGRDGAILLVGADPHDLVQRAERQPAAGQRRVDDGQPQRHGAPGVTALLEHLDAGAQGAKTGVRRSAHGTSIIPMFVFCSIDNDSPSSQESSMRNSALADGRP